jgi:hypothetical protein
VYSSVASDFLTQKNAGLAVPFQVIFRDRVQEKTPAGWGGTGDVALGGAEVGYQTFASQAGGANFKCFYAIQDTVAGAWEVGQGTYNASANTLTRTTVKASSNSNQLVPFTITNIKDVQLTVGMEFFQAFDSARVYFDRVQETHSGSLAASATTVSLGGAQFGFKAFKDVMAVNNQFYYGIQDSAGNWEIGQGTYTALNTMSRDRVISSSALGAFVTFNSTRQDVYLTVPDELLASIP